MKAAQKRIGRNRAHLEHLPELLRPRFGQLQVPNEVKGAILARRHPPLLRRPALGLADLVHHRLPSPNFHHRISRRQIGPRHLQADDGFTVGLVLGEEQALGFDLIAGAKARLFFGSGVLDEKAPALSPE